MNKLFAGVPAYNGMVHIDCVNTLLGLSQIGIPSSTMFIGNESLITRGRNTIFSMFVHLYDFTHLLFLDADVGISAMDIRKMLDYNKDVLGVPVRLKGVDKRGNPVYNVGKLLGPSDNGLLKYSKIGTAVLMVSRDACEKLIEKTEPDTYKKSISNGISMENIVQYDVFKTGVIDGEYQSEDFWFCEKLREVGYDIFVDPNIKTVHNGVLQLS